jgi:hypothetical protein
MPDVLRDICAGLWQKDCMADVYKLKHKRKRIAIPSAASYLFGDMGHFTVFTIMIRRKTKRRERHTEVWLWTDGNFGLNLSAVKGIFPDSEEGARKWLKTFAEGHGLHLTERLKVKKHIPRGNREQYRDLKAGVVKEEWLASDVPALWAEAMVRCQHPGGHCGQDGFCHYGDCNMQMMPEKANPEE